jgi:hypothetical protein
MKNKFLSIPLSISFVWFSAVPQGSASAPYGKQQVSKPSQGRSIAQAPTIGQAPVEEEKPAAWRFSNEQEWIVDSTARDVAEMLAYAKLHGGKFSPSDIKFTTTTVDLKSNAYKVDFSLAEPKAQATSEFNLVNYAWSPDNYEAFAKTIIEQLKLKPSAVSKPPADFLKKLASTQTADLLQESTRVSRALSESPLDAGLHEQAALIQATFDMLELAGHLSDTRPPLARISAHLTLAKALNKGHLDTAGKLANIALVSMSCRDGEAVKLADEMANTEKDAVVLSWLRALKIRSSGDYRLFDEKASTPLEATQFGMRYSNFRDSDTMLSWIDEHHTPWSVRWMRIVECGSASVGSGHRVTSHLVSAEMKDFLTDYNLFKGVSEVDPAKAIKELNLTATRCLTESANGPQLVVLSWADVAAYHCRHIMSAVFSEYRYYHNSYGVEEMAKATLTGAKTLFSGLTLYPFAIAWAKLPANELQSEIFSPAQYALQAHPEQVVCGAWGGVKRRAAEEAPNTILVSPELWFAPPLPMGTAFYFFDRSYYLKTCKPDLEQLTELRKICPLDEGVCKEWALKKYGDHPTSDQMAEAYGPLLEFDVPVMQETAAASISQPEKFIAQEEKIAKIDPEAYFNLGRYCALRARSEEAAKFFQLGVDKCENSVLTSNSVEWLIEYQEGKGKAAEAKKLADFAAEVYSQRGLESKALWQERKGDLAGAEQTYKDIDERYETKEDLLAFYLRNSGKNTRYDTEGKRLEKEIFPEGRQAVKLLDFKDAPDSGMWIVQPDWLADPATLEKDTVIVAVNGWRVRTKAQYDVALALNIEPKATVIVWNGKEYSEVASSLCGRRLNIAMKEYKPSAAETQMQKPLLNFLENLNQMLQEQRKKLDQPNNQPGAPPAPPAANDGQPKPSAKPAAKESP